MRFILLFLYSIYAYESNCYKCIWKKSVFPEKRYCIYYQQYINTEFNNCTKYKLKDLDW